VMLYTYDTQINFKYQENVNIKLCVN